ncbi:MAG: hypothetical protein ABIQ99_14285 [Thermoflexales bacterium]
MRFGRHRRLNSIALARSFGQMGPAGAVGGDRLMRAATQFINILWVVALTSLRGALTEFSPAQIPASVLSFGGLAIISIAAHRLREQLACDAWFVTRWASWSVAAIELWDRVRSAAHTAQVWSRACPPEPGLFLASIAMEGAAIFRWRLRAPEAAAALAQRIQRLLRHAPIDIEALRRWLSDWLPDCDPAAGLRLEGTARAHGLISTRVRPTLFAPISLPQRC